MSSTVDDATERRNNEILGANTWTKATIIGIFAGLPTAFFMQIGFVKTLRARGEPLKKTRHWLLPPGIGHAIMRDVIYSIATQKQVQNAQISGSSTFAEDVALNAAVVFAPLFFDTLSIKTVKPAFVTPRQALALLKVACPPEAVLGRFLWAPLYNWVYVNAQASIGDENAGLELAGLIAGSIAASYVAFPVFMFKTNLLMPTSGGAAASSQSGGSMLVHMRQWGNLMRTALIQTCGAGLKTLPSISNVVSNPQRLYKGAVPHMWGNVGPDVLCMAIGRMAFAQMVALGMVSSLYSAAPETETNK